ncbi:MAG: hypothetical protein ACJ8LM_06975, partial [Candidatus Udaeobacter sp.]
VVDRNQQNITVARAYVRFSPELAGVIVAMATMFWLRSLPEFRTVQSFQDLRELFNKSPFEFLRQSLYLLVIVDCITAAFNTKKRAIHDFLAGSYCIYRC